MHFSFGSTGRALVALPLVLAAWVLLASAQTEPAATRGVVQLELRGAIGPASSDYVVRGLERAAKSGAALLVIEMDTPGGLDAAMRDINRAILASAVPVATFVTPQGSRAASAGTYILYASHLAVMSPATNLGAATPVQIGGGSKPASPAGPAGENSDAEGKQSTPSDPMERKSVNDAVAYIRGLAELRGRNADWAERAVRDAATLTAEQAAATNVIDFVAEDLDALLAAAEGRTVRVQNRDLQLETGGLSVERYLPDWRTRLLAVITDPSVAYILLLIGIYGLIFEGYNPGAILPGVVGTIALLLALFAFQVLPVNYAGLGLMALGALLLAAEAFVPSFGVLGLGGIVAFVFGSILLFETGDTGLEISGGLIAGVGFVASVALLAMLVMFARARKRRVVTGREGLIGQSAEAIEDFDARGPVYVQGERWNAVAASPVRKGERLRVTGLDGLVVRVEHMDAS